MAWWMSKPKQDESVPPRWVGELQKDVGRINAALGEAGMEFDGHTDAVDLVRQLAVQRDAAREHAQTYREERDDLRRELFAVREAAGSVHGQADDPKSQPVEWMITLRSEHEQPPSPGAIVRAGAAWAPWRVLKVEWVAEPRPIGGLQLDDHDPDEDTMLVPTRSIAVTLEPVQPWDVGPAARVQELPLPVVVLGEDCAPALRHRLPMDWRNPLEDPPDSYDGTTPHPEDLVDEGDVPDGGDVLGRA